MIGGCGGIRTHTVRILSPLPLPLGYTADKIFQVSQQQIYYIMFLVVCQVLIFVYFKSYFV